MWKSLHSLNILSLKRKKNEEIGTNMNFFINVDWTSQKYAMDKNQHTIVIQTLNLSYDTSAKIKDVLNRKCYLRECN